MYREITNGFYWIQELGSTRDDIVAQLDDDQDWYHPGEDVYVPQNAYLLCSDKTLLFDTTSPANTESILSDLTEILGPDGLDYLIVSHPDIPHAGNSNRILEQFPSAELVAPSYGTLHDLYHLGAATQVDIGDSIDIGNRRVTFTEAPILDAAMTHWMIEETTKTLFTVDWMCFPHMGSEEHQFVDEIKSDVTVQRFLEFNARVIFWLQYVDPDLVINEIERFLDSYDIEMIAPTHGLVIRRDAKKYFDRYPAVVEHVAEHGRAQNL